MKLTIIKNCFFNLCYKNIIISLLVFPSKCFPMFILLKGIPSELVVYRMGEPGNENRLFSM